MSDSNETESQEKDFILINDTMKHEALDRCLMLSDILSNHLFDHPFVQAIPEFKNTLDGILDEMMDFYQEMANFELNDQIKYYYEEDDIYSDDDENEDDDDDHSLDKEKEQA